jgi:hypothetical protein
MHLLWTNGALKYSFKKATFAFKGVASSITFHPPVFRYSEPFSILFDNVTVMMPAGETAAIIS